MHRVSLHIHTSCVCVRVSNIIFINLNEIRKIMTVTFVLMCTISQVKHFSVWFNSSSKLVFFLIGYIQWLYQCRRDWKFVIFCRTLLVHADTTQLKHNFSMQSSHDIIRYDIFSDKIDTFKQLQRLLNKY